MTRCPTPLDTANTFAVLALIFSETRYPFTEKWTSLKSTPSSSFAPFGVTGRDGNETGTSPQEGVPINAVVFHPRLPARADAQNVGHFPNR